MPGARRVQECASQLLPLSASSLLFASKLVLVQALTLPQAHTFHMLLLLKSLDCTALIAAACHVHIKFWQITDPNQPMRTF